MKSVKRTKKVAAAPYVAKQTPKKETNPLIEKRPKNFGIGEIDSESTSRDYIIMLCAL